ncbi:precorrin-2 dehydrogenase/sirohydrochlorin ferrochelatase family protein [Halegenticoccus tardaugens]|uniref:precorrin-2 dehydrogenase/sirohydrochlorin ferrochelatase family protein n=1 Tax=Halegenticoccus tardaugens TaxID=2071624 RepID=UPI00100A52C5|nr:bifunctional precorrin-2 dehydrogenase/sirohydrochlorin ferrochelatase [Halegenticoccus tardaugens]
MIPLFHDFDGETVLVFGGGPVGARKARRFAREARVVVVAPTFADREFGAAELVRAAPAPDEVAAWVDRFDPALVVAATDDEAVNEAAEAAARERCALVNRADEAGGRDRGSVVVPATVRDGPVTVAVSTGGASPALSKLLRERLESELADAGAMATLTADLRAELKDEGAPADERRTAVRAVVRDPRVWKALRTGESKARREADRVIRETRGESR